MQITRSGVLGWKDKPICSCVSYCQIPSIRVESIRAFIRNVWEHLFPQSLINQLCCCQFFIAAIIIGEQLSLRVLLTFISLAMSKLERILIDLIAIWILCSFVNSLFMFLSIFLSFFADIFFCLACYLFILFVFLKDWMGRDWGSGFSSRCFRMTWILSPALVGYEGLPSVRQTEAVLLGL